MSQESSHDEVLTVSNMQMKHNNTFKGIQDTLALFENLKRSMQESRVFDDQDVQEVEKEMERIDNQEIKRLREMCMKRLEVLNAYDQKLDFAKHHPLFNQFIIQKQQQMMALLSGT